MNTVPDLLEEAANLLETVGWVKGTQERRVDGSVIGYCAIGAMRAAAASQASINVYMRAEDLFNAWVRREIGAIGIVAWNDDVAKGSSEIIDGMKQCAKDLRNEAVPS
jgi:hypothetical protein